MGWRKGYSGRRECDREREQSNAASEKTVPTTATKLAKDYGPNRFDIQRHTARHSPLTIYHGEVEGGSPLILPYGDGIGEGPLQHL